MFHRLTDRDAAALDEPVGAALHGTHRALGRSAGRAAAYLPEVAGFASVPAEARPEDWADLAGLLGRGELADLFSVPADPPADWEPVFALDGLQLVRTAEPAPGDAEDGGAPGPALVELGAEDVPEMLDLVERTKPGPFRPRTRELGTYLGIREDGALTAMAGERLRPPGWTEVSAVCCAPESRGRGHAGRLVRALAARITARGDRPFLHVAAGNAGAVALYEKLGFEIRKPVVFRGYRIP